LVPVVVPARKGCRFWARKVPGAYTPAEVEAIARAAQAGAHRDNRLKLTPGEVEARGREDAQDACLILVAAFCGLRIGGVPGIHCAGGT
jgi:hypothetical protein